MQERISIITLHFFFFFLQVLIWVFKSKVRHTERTETSKGLPTSWVSLPHRILEMPNFRPNLRFAESKYAVNKGSLADSHSCKSLRSTDLTGIQKALFYME